ncbi:MAG: hypothetical protein ABJD68_02850, partial [Nakamurella sp.]
KVCSIVAGMLTGADSIDDLGVLREGAVGKVLPGVKAPSTLGTFLRAFTFGHVKQLGAVAAGFLTALVTLVPLLTGHGDAVTWLDVDDTMRRTRGYAKQGVGYGCNKIKGFNALLGIVSITTGAPIIVGHRLRKGAVNSARGAGKFRSDTISAGRRAGAGPVIRCQLDSAFCNHGVITAIMAAKAQFSITARMDKAVQKAITGIDENAWVHIKYPEAIYDEEQQRWISDAQVAEIDYTSFTSRGRHHQITARLIVRRVKRVNPASAPQGQNELFAVYRHHAVFTKTTEPTLLAEAHHRDHAIVEQVIADLKSSALAHFPDVSSDERQRRLADLRGDRPQPGPGRRGAGRRETGQGPDHHDQGHADQHPRPGMHHSPDLHAAPAGEFPPRATLYGHVRRHPGTTPAA